MRIALFATCIVDAMYPRVALATVRVLDRLGALGVAYDAEANRARVAGPHTISAPESAIPVLVVPTDEEQAIARLTWELAR